MKRLVIICVCALFLSSCSPSVLLLQGNYPRYNYTIETTISADKVWDNIIDWFFNTETPIVLLDKDSGIIVSGAISLRSKSVEESNGLLPDKDAYCLIAEDPNVDICYTSNITGVLMARVVTNNDKTFVKVALSNIECRNTSYQYIEAKSTGVFEKKWLKNITAE